MQASRITQVILLVAFLLIVFGEATVQTAIELGHAERPQVMDLLTRAPSKKNLRAFESRLETNAWATKALRPAMQYARFAAYRDLGEKALAGQNDWLFYRPGVNFLIEPWPEVRTKPADDPLKAIVAFRDALTGRGIALLVVPAPGKASVYPDRLSARAAGTDANVHRHAEAFMDRLKSAGVSYVDLFAAFDADRADETAPGLYLARDTHWSPAGLQLAATAVAVRVRAEGWVQAGRVAYLERAVTVQREGDVLRMMNAPRIAAAFSPETMECTQIIDATTGEPYADDPDSPILVLGDSFLRIYQQDEPGAAGFIAHLARALKQPLASIVNDGGASTLVRQELQRKPELLRGKKLVIWEFVERDLRFGMEGWKLVKLPSSSEVN